MEKYELRREFFRVTRDMQKFVHELMAPICQKHGATLHQLYILTELNMEPNQTISQLSDRVGILRTNFTQVCRKMEGAGLVERRHNATDRRSYTLRLTDRGELLLSEIEGDIASRYNDRFNAEPEETFATIIDGFEALRSFTAKFEV